MKRFLYTLLIICFCTALILYFKTYAITNNKEQLESNIKHFINNNEPIVKVNNITIRKQIDIDNKKLVLYGINNKSLGIAELSRGVNCRYRVHKTHKCTGCIEYENCKTNKGKYLVISGKNCDNNIAYIKVSLGRKKHKLNIPRGRYFLVKCKLSSKHSDEIVNNDIVVYNKNNINITNKIFDISFQ
ncbi:hypothetical protein [Clostridium sp. Marseille-Q2269]|uniref:hypothetical protein n=1 Tax=Clostridium sp. Marseille-Q2269 TaxID=2942205 RepID=UPI00207345B2|nr:hypothetical protein [Clostridium sp. Marseille-Q2269]